MIDDTRADVVRLAVRAMNCRFEMVLHGGDHLFLHAAGEEALAEITDLGQQLSCFDPASDISHINRKAYHAPQKVEPQLFELLQMCQCLWKETGGVFDPTIGPLLDIWGWSCKEGRIPDGSEKLEALLRVGMDKVILNQADHTVQFKVEGISLNLGSIGKGYALDRAADILAECGVANALLHGGTSSILALGNAPNGKPWKVGLADPADAEKQVGVVSLHNCALAVSSNNINYLTVENERLGHVLDPRTGNPANQCLLAAVVAENATLADAYSTALLAKGNMNCTWLKEQRDALVIDNEGSINMLKSDGGSSLFSR
jgi:FAD:protein FMN transferase